MALLAKTPFYLKIIYKILGITQFITGSSSWFLNLWHIIPFCYYLYAFFSSISNAMVYYEIQIGIFPYIHILIFYFGCFSVVVHMIAFYRRSTDLKHILMGINEISLKLQCEYKIKERKSLAPIIFLGIILTNYSFMIIASILVLPIGTSITKYFFFYYFPLIVGGMDHIFLSDILHEVMHNLEIINKAFRKQANAVDLAKLFPLTKTSTLQKLKREEVNLNIQQISNLAYIHYDLIAFVQQLNNIFGFTSLISMTSLFICKLNLFYYITFHVAFLYLQFNAEYILLCSLLILVELYLSFWLIYIIQILSHTRAKAIESISYVHQIWNKYASRNEIVDKIRHLRLISMQMQNTRIQFTASDLFDLDHTFYLTVNTSISIYVLILVQFYI